LLAAALAYAAVIELATELCRLAFEYAMVIWSVAKATAHPDDWFFRYCDCTADLETDMKTLTGLPWAICCARTREPAALGGAAVTPVLAEKL
jgi:hypothetical protein